MSIGLSSGIFLDMPTLGSLGGLTATIGTPTLALTSGNLVYPPTFNVGFDNTVQVGDTLDFQYTVDPAFATGITTVLHVITSGEATAHALSLSLAGIVSGTHRYRCRVERGGLYTAWSTPIVTQGPNDIAPNLSAFTATAIGTTTATVGVTTDAADGTLYHLRNTSATAVAVATIVGTGTPLAITSAGAKTFALTALTQTTAYYDHFAHTPAVGPTSLELIGTFTTATAPAFSATEVAAPATITQSSSGTTTFTALAAGTADSTRILVALIDAWNGGGAIPTAVTIGGVAATHAVGCDAFSQSVWYAAVPTGTTADVVISLTSVINATVKLWRVVGSQAAPTQAVNVAFAFTSPSTSIAVTVPVGGASIIQVWSDTTGRTVGWTGATGASLNNTTLRSIASASATATGTVTAAWSGGNGNFLASAVSFGP